MRGLLVVFALAAIAVLFGMVLPDDAVQAQDCSGSSAACSGMAAVGCSGSARVGVLAAARRARVVQRVASVPSRLVSRLGARARGSLRASGCSGF